jgi:hypothetical protein
MNWRKPASARFSSESERQPARSRASFGFRGSGLRAQKREEDHVANRLRSGQNHRQPVAGYSPAASIQRAMTGPAAVILRTQPHVWITNITDNSVTEIVGSAGPVPAVDCAYKCNRRTHCHSNHTGRACRRLPAYPSAPVFERGANKLQWNDVRYHFVSDLIDLAEALTCAGDK